MTKDNRSKAENIAYNACQLFTKECGNDKAIPMYSHGRPANIFWTGFCGRTA